MTYIFGLFIVNISLITASVNFRNDMPQSEEISSYIDHEMSRNLLDKELEVVESVIGGRAAIPCAVSTPLEDAEASLILWYKVGLPNPIYTLDLRNVPFRGAKHFPSIEMGVGASADLSVNPPRLIIYPVFEDDQGDYKCRVDLRQSRTLILHSRLRVIVPPSEPIVMDEHGQHLYDVIGPYDEGSNLTFICEVDGGEPSPNVTWWRGSTLIDDDFNVTTDGFVRNELLLYKIQRADLLEEFTCRAENTLLVKPKDATLQVDINLLPLEARIILPKTILIAGEEYEIFCETKGSRPRALTTWWLDGQKIGIETPEGLLEGSNDTLSTLHFIPKPSDDEKHLICKSVNPALPKKIVEDEITLKVQFKPLVNISLSTKANHSRIKEGSDVIMECTILANPWITNFTWQFETKNLTTNKSAGIIISNHSLMLLDINKDHRGRYRCVANNSVGEGWSNYLRLYVQFTPVCRSTEPKIYGISPTEILNVTCDMEADPRDTQIRWSFNNSQGLQIMTNWTKGGPRSVFSYSPKTEEGYGTLLCWTKNSLGTQKNPCIIKVVPAGAPDSPHDCAVSNQTSTVIFIECEAGYNGSLSQMFHLEVYDSIMDHLATNLSTLDRPSFKAENLSSGTSYVLVIYSSNIKGRSNSVALVGTTLRPAEKRRDQETDQSLGSSVILLITIPVLVISLVVLIVLCRNLFHVFLPEDRPQEKDNSVQTASENCDIPKKELEESQDTSEKGPDIIPMSKDSEVFYMGNVTEIPMLDIKQDESSSEYVHQKYTDTVL